MSDYNYQLQSVIGQLNSLTVYMQRIADAADRTARATEKLVEQRTANPVSEHRWALDE